MEVIIPEIVDKDATQFKHPALKFVKLNDKGNFGQAPNPLTSLQLMF